HVAGVASRLLRDAWAMHGSAPGRALAGRFMAGAFALRTRRSVRLRIARGNANRVCRRTRRDRTRTRQKHSAPLAIAFLDFRTATGRSYLPAREADPLRIRLRALGPRLLPNWFRDTYRLGREAGGWW